jgi:ABC-2 type transport system ATP-binding protein
VTAKPVVEVDHVTKRFGRRVVLDDVSFAVECGSVVGLVGPNGSGKTTLLHILLGLVLPSSGEVRLWRSSPATLPDFGRRVGWVLESVGLHPGFTAAESLALLGTRLGADRQRQGEVLHMVGLADASRRRVGEFSLGMRQRLSIGAALVADPELLLLDEPTTGLDPTGIRWLRDLLVDLRGRGVTILLSSHLLDELAKLADDVVVLRAGRVVAAGPVDRLAQAVPALDVRTPDVARARAVLFDTGAELDVRGDVLRVSGLSTDDVLRLLVAARVPIAEVVEVRPDLEQAVLDALEPCS